MIKRTWYIILPALLIIQFVSGQDYIFKRYNASDGLINNVLLDITQDSYGFLWLPTVSGLSSFDGKNFKNYSFTEGLQNLVVNKIFEDSRHRLWIGTAKGIAQLKGNRFKMYTDKAPGENLILGFGEYKEWGILAFTEAGIFRLENDSTWIKTDVLPGYKGKNCLDIAETEDGMYLNYEDEVVFKKKNGIFVVLLKDTTDNAESYCNGLVKKDGKLFAGVRNQLYQLSEGKATLIIDSIPIRNFFNYTVDTANTFWVNTGGSGLYKYQLKQNKKIVSVYHYESNSNGFPFVDHQGNLWITSFEGLIRVSPKIFEDLSPPVLQGAEKRMNIIPGTFDDVVLSDETGLNVLRNGSIQKLKRPVSYRDDKSYSNDIVEGYAKDRMGNTWLMTRQRKLLCWNGTQLLDYSHLVNPGAYDYIRNVAVNPLDNKVFICDDTTLMCGFESKFAPFRDKSGNIFPRTTTVLFTHNGVGIINVFSKGVYFITKDKRIIKAPSELDIIDKGGFTYFFEDKDGSIWISNAGKGLVHFRIDENDYSIKNLSVLTTAQGLPSNKISYMAFDGQGRKWIGCSNGIVVLEYNATDSSNWDVYTIGHEQNIDLQPPAAMITDNISNVWLASLSTLLKIDVKKLVLKKVKPGIVIQNVLLNMRETNWTELSDSVTGYFQLPVSPKLGYAQNTLGIEFTGVSLYNAENFEYSYQLEPLDKTWSVPSGSKIISLVSLVPGKYIFKVRARGKGTEWSSPASFNFTITPPFWDTWWFRSLLLILTATIIVAIYRNRVRKIRDEADLQNQMRELEMKALKAQMNPHFIYNALNSVQSLIADNRKNEAIDYIGKFSRLLRQVLDYSDNNIISLDKELQSLNLYIQLDSLRLNMDLEYNVKTDSELITENEKVPPLILQPFVENALWHGLSKKKGIKQLNITISVLSGILKCVVEDNGIGRVSAASFKKQSSSDEYSSKGIDMTIHRLTDFNKSKISPVEYTDLYDESGNAAGTRVTVFIRRLQ